MKFLHLYNNHFARLHESFEKAIQAQGYNLGRDCEPANHIKEFIFFLETKGILKIQHVKAAHIIEYYEYLRERPNQRREGGLGDSSIRKHIYALRLFFDYLLEIKEVQSSPARLPKFLYGDYMDRSIISVEEINLLYKYARNSTERAILGLAYGCGLRRTEIELLDVNDLIFSKGILTVRKGKGNKNRVIPMPDKVIKDLKEYLVYERSKRLKKSTAPFFLNRWGGRMQGQSFNHKLKELIERTGEATLINRGISLHSLRHSIATHMIDMGADIDFVRRFLGHVMLDTTNLYSKRRKQQIKNTINR